jgi:FkbM family methyltransferase
MERNSQHAVALRDNEDMKEHVHVAVSTASEGSHHYAFHRFPRWQGKVPEGFIVNFLGVHTRTSYWPEYKTISNCYPPDRFVATEYPAFDEEYFEWIDLLEAVTAAESHFTMIELGAGFGRWTVNAAAALRHLGSTPYTLIAVEAEPTHYQWLVQHFPDNGLEPKNFHLIQAAVAPADGNTGFYLGETQWGGPTNFYGQSIGGPHLIDAVSLKTLLQPLPAVDLIDIDIQGAELEVLEAGAQELDEKVKRVHVGTHSSRNEEGLRSLFGSLGWRCFRSFPSSATVDTEWGVISFQDGVQTWLNPAFQGAVDEVTVLRQKLQASRREAARLWVQLDNVRGQQAGAPVPGSLAWKIINRARTLRDRMVPRGTWRRRAFDFIATKL